MSFVRSDYYAPHDNNAISDRSAFKYKRSEMQLEWTGRLVGTDEWEPKHPQLLLRPRPDRMFAPNPRPEQPSGLELGPILSDSQMV